MVSAKTMANGYQPSTKGKTWGEEPVAHTFDLAHPHTRPCSQRRPAPTPHMPLFLPFFSQPKSRRPLTVTTKPHTETHSNIYLLGPPPRHRAGYGVGACVLAGVVGGGALRARCLRICPVSRYRPDPILVRQGGRRQCGEARQCFEVVRRFFGIAGD